MSLRPHCKNHRMVKTLVSWKILIQSKESTSGKQPMTLTLFVPNIPNNENFVSQTFFQSTCSFKEYFEFQLLWNCHFSIFGAHFNKLLPMNFAEILFFSRYNLKGIQVTLEISLPSSFYLFCFCFILHSPFIILTLRRVMC